MKNKHITGTVSVVTLCAALTVVLYYFIYFVLCVLGYDSRLMCLFALFVMACAALPVIYADKLKSRLGRAFRPLQIIFTLLLIVYIISVIIFWCYINLSADTSPEAIVSDYTARSDSGEDTVVLVFGCRAYGMQPSRTLKSRLDTAYTLLKGLPDAVCIVSGGQGNNEIYPEATVMKEYLSKRGIDPSRIITESESHSTSENVRFTKSLIDELGLQNKTVIGVSTAFHLPRIELLSERYELPMDVCASESPSFGHFYVSMVREYLSYIKMALFDQAVIITRVT